MPDETKCDICGLNIRMDSELLNELSSEDTIRTLQLLQNTEQLPVKFKSWKNTKYGSSVSYCAINHPSHFEPTLCEHWQLHTGRELNEYISIHQAKSNYYLARIALGVSLASLAVALLSYFRPETETTSSGKTELKVQRAPFNSTVK